MTRTSNAAARIRRSLNLATAVSSRGSKNYSNRGRSRFRCAPGVRFIAALLATCSLLTGAARAVTVPSPTISHVAAQDNDGNAAWEDVTAVGGFDWSFAGSLSPVATGQDGATTISSAYEFPAAVGTTNAFTLATRGADASFEVWFRPSDLTGEHILIEHGGTAGTALLLDENQVRFASQRSLSNVLSQSATLPSGATSRFHQLVGVVRFLSSDSAAIDFYLNGGFIGSDSTPSGFDLWAGTSSSGLGDVDTSGADFGGVTLLDAAPTAFDGEIAIVNFYDFALTADEVGAAFRQFAVPEPSTGLLLATFCFARCRFRRRRNEEGEGHSAAT